MKQIYTDIKPQYGGSHKAGICSVFVIPREWLTADPQIDFDTGRIMVVPTLQPNRFWIQLELLQQSYSFQEDQKSAKSGSYKETELSGDLNFFNYLLLQQLETLRRSELVVLLTDHNRRRRLVGNTIAGMQLSYNYALADVEKISITLQCETEAPAPYYNPDGEPEIIFNLLENLDGNFLLVK